MEISDTAYIGKVFKTYRNKENFTQEYVAEKIDVTARHIMALEYGERMPSFEVLLKLARLLNIPGDALLHPELSAADTEAQELLRLFMKLNARDKAVILAAIKKMLETAE